MVMPHGFFHTIARFLVLLAVLGVAYVLLVRSEYYRSTQHERSAIGNKWSSEGFEVAVVWPKHVDLNFVQGVGMAVEEIDAARGQLAGKIKLRLFEEPTNTPQAVDLARKIAGYPKVIAVLGHELSADAIPASLTYEEHGILFLTPTATEPRLTEHGFTYVFRLTPDDEMTADAIAQFAKQRGWTRVGVLYGRNDHGDSASEEFFRQSQEHGVTIPFARSYLEDEEPGGEDFRPLVAEIRKESFDAIMLADIFPWAGLMIKDLALMGVTQPILATDKLDSPELWQMANTAANNVYVASAVDPTNTAPAYQAFRQRFEKRFGAPPSYGATQGYESLTLLANACIKSQSADPIVVATTLRTNSWTGLFGAFTFDVSGDVLNRKISIKRMQNGTFITEASETAQKDDVETLVTPGERQLIAFTRRYR